MIARFLNPKQKKESRGQLNVILALQELTFKRYEGQKCTSGFVFTEDVEGFKDKVKSSKYTFYEFKERAELTQSYFSTPATYRYVDGRNSFYLLDNKRKIHGILRLKNPDIFSLVDRIGNRHLKELIENLPGNNWISFVGLKDEVYIIVGENQQLKWSNNHWHFRDREIILSLLGKFGLNGELDKLLVNIIFSISEIRYGSIILIPEDDNVLPPIIGKIDQSPIGTSLRNLIQQTSAFELASSNSILGILTSDGLTTISKKGSILSCGDIIDINKAAQQKIQGGGRSQAAIASSFFGVVIKVSQDGPISFYYKGELLIEL